MATRPPAANGVDEGEDSICTRPSNASSALRVPAALASTAGANGGWSSRARISEAARRSTPNREDEGEDSGCTRSSNVDFGVGIPAAIASATRGGIGMPREPDSAEESGASAGSGGTGADAAIGAGAGGAAACCGGVIPASAAATAPGVSAGGASRCSSVMLFSFRGFQPGPPFGEIVWRNESSGSAS
jgi:hypothetical protein